jgi:hypothetical protein
MVRGPFLLLVRTRPNCVSIFFRWAFKSVALRVQVNEKAVLIKSACSVKPTALVRSNVALFTCLSIFQVAQRLAEYVFQHQCLSQHQQCKTALSKTLRSD